MGTFSVRIAVRNPFRREGEAECEALVDAGATYTVLPASLLRSLGVEPVRRVRLRLADGRVVERDLGQVEVEIPGYGSMVTPAVFGEEGICLLGAVTLEQFSLAPDPVEKRLRPVEALMLAVPRDG